MEPDSFQFKSSGLESFAKRYWTLFWKTTYFKWIASFDFIVSDKRQIGKVVTVLNSFSTGSDHRIIRKDIEREKQNDDEKR